MEKRAVGIVIKDNKILLIRRFRGEKDGWTKGRYFVFPGGGVEDGEMPEEGCIREIKEELSLDAKVDKLLFVMHNPAKVHDFLGRDEYFYLITDFTGEAALGGPEKERMNENDQFHLEWIPIDQMKDMPTLYPKEAKEKIISLLNRQENMQTNNGQPDLEAKMNEIIAEEEGYGEVDPTPEEQERYLSKYSFSALVFSAFYFWYMKDKVFFWLSIITSILFFPIMFILPFLARRRAWKEREWRSFGQYLSVQKKWDKAAIYGTVIFILVFFCLGYFETKLINNYLNSSGVQNMNDVKQLQDDLQNTIGN